MSILATIRPDDWNFPLLLHVFGALTLLGALVTAGSAMVIGWKRETAVDAITWARVSFRTLLIVALPAWFLMRSGGLRGASRGELARIGVAGLLVVGVYHIALNEGERFTTSGTASVIVSTAPAMTLALAIALGLERFSAARTLGLVVAFVGVVVEGRRVLLFGAQRRRVLLQ